jgi:hypothetical protein
VTWEESDDVDYPFRATVGGEEWVIRINDFPEDPLYTLIIGGQAIVDLDDWPPSWRRPKGQEDQTGPMGAC